MSAIDALGVVGSIFTIIGFLQSNLPGKPENQGTAVRVKAGLTSIGDDVDDLGGGISNVYAFNRFNEYIGQSGGASIKDGDFHDFVVDQSSPGVQGDYIGIANGNDATCVSWVSVTMFDGTLGGAWTGDIGMNCGQRWHYGNQGAGHIKDSGDPPDEYVPMCTWLDADFTDGTVSTAMKFRVKAYGDEVNDTLANSHECGSTLWGTEDGPIAGQPEKRTPPPRPTWVEERLVISNITGQTAKMLCQSATSWGPDFVGPDGLFCDMGTKELLPLCTTEDSIDCVETSEQALELTKRSAIAGRSGKVVHKSYKTLTRNNIGHARA